MAERGRAPLPAPYESPWTLLGRDLRALAASGRLKTLELRRRNASGDLPLPEAWPRALAPLFWPLVLAACLAAVLLLLTSLPRLWPTVQAPPAGPPEANRRVEQPREAAEPEPEALEPVEPVGALERVEPQDPAASAESAEPEAEEPEAAEPEADPSPLAAAYAADLRALARAPKAGPLWLQAEPLPSQASLRLRLGDPYGSLEEGQREQLAALWWQRAQEEGWERLELVDPQGRRLGQSARLGSGMILLDPHLLP